MGWYNINQLLYTLTVHIKGYPWEPSTLYARNPGNVSLVVFDTKILSLWLATSSEGEIGALLAILTFASL